MRKKRIKVQSFFVFFLQYNKVQIPQNTLTADRENDRNGVDRENDRNDGDINATGNGPQTRNDQRPGMNDANGSQTRDYFLSLFTIRLLFNNNNIIITI